MAGGLMERAPTASGQMLLALDMFLGPTAEIVVLGNPTIVPMLPQCWANCGNGSFPTK